MGTRKMELTREEFYEEVWSAPMVHLAAKYGCSDVGLAKTCRRFNIPRPPHGYWQELRAGKMVRKTPLTPMEPDPRVPKIVLFEYEKDTKDCDPEQLKAAEERCWRGWRPR